MPDRERKRVPDDRSDILKESLPKIPLSDLTGASSGFALFNGHPIAEVAAYLDDVGQDDDGNSQRDERYPQIRDAL